jgi:hypothetical protein
MNLKTGKSLTPYVHQRDLGRIDCWKNLANDKFGYTNPNDPKKQRTFTLGNNSQKRVDVMTNIDRHILDLAMEGELSNQADIIAELNSINGVTVSRNTKTSISINVIGYEKPIRLKGEIYGKSYGGIENIEEQKRERNKRFIAERDKRIKTNSAELNQRITTICNARKATNAKPAAAKLAVPNAPEPSANSGWSVSELVHVCTSSTGIPEVSNSDKGQRHTTSVLPSKTIKNNKNKLKNDVNDNTEQLKNSDGWAYRLIKNLGNTINKVGGRIIELCAASKGLTEQIDSNRRQLEVVRNNAKTIDLLIAGTAIPAIKSAPRHSPRP